VNKSAFKDRIPTTIEELLNENFDKKIVFGGVNNSAGISVIQGISYKYGETKVHRFIDSSIIKEMPIQAFDYIKKVENKFNFTYPNDDWFAQLDYNEFNDKYNKITSV